MCVRERDRERERERKREPARETMYITLFCLMTSCWSLFYSTYFRKKKPLNTSEIFVSIQPHTILFPRCKIARMMTGIQCHSNVWFDSCTSIKYICYSLSINHLVSPDTFCVWIVYCKFHNCNVLPFHESIYVARDCILVWIRYCKFHNCKIKHFHETAYV